MIALQHLEYLLAKVDSTRFLWRRVVGEAFLLLLLLSSCTSESEAYDPYHDWQSRNEAWFMLVADSARTAISHARQQYGEAWEAHCDWRMFKTLLKDQNRQSGELTDTVCVRIVSRGTGRRSPVFTDSVRVNFRAVLLPVVDSEGNTEQTVFTQTYYGTFNPQTASPAKYWVGGQVAGFATALQYMVEGDDWVVYIPAELGYGSSSTSSIPAYSTLRYRTNLVGIYPTGTKVPDWQ